MKVSILIPYIRPDGAKLAAKAAKINAGISDIEILMEEDTERIGCPRMLKRLVEKSKGEYICFIGDDTVPAHNFLKIALEEMQAFPDGIGLIGFNDTSGRFPQGRELANHWIAHRQLLDHLDGEFFHTGYKHCFCDNELQERVTALRRYKYSQDAVIMHENPLVCESGQWDDDYKRIYSSEVYNADKELFNQRKENGWKS